MKKMLLTAALFAFAIGTQAQNFVFTTVKENPITSVKNQNRSSTCWSFSGLGFMESELLRTGKGEYDLSEMFVVHHTMTDRAERYVRMHGDGGFSPGGSFYDVLYTWKNYGIVPQDAMPGIKYGEPLPIHNELDAVAGGYVNAIAKGKFSKLTSVWKQGLSAVYDTYLGELPETFTYNGKEYTPKTFAQSLGLNPDDYISLTSYTHYPFYTEFSLEIPDNWRNALSWNVPLNEMMSIIDNAVNNGYTVAWASDVSEMGFSRNGIAVVPDMERTDLSGSDMARWTGLTTEDKRKEVTSKPAPEKTITQEMRQMAYDNWETTDDHGMQIYGIAKDQTGKSYYMVKNSWGTNNTFNGTWYASKAFVEYKTMNIVVHKDAIPRDIARKMGLK
ncbi:aminopeptidase C [Bacteroides sp. 519]|uniref:aminopeptidase C n=1 Tax=Bacteroides sp. 519 TaxID=2302937 RepID=UPI0013D02E73|nr:C1 family peptidase [Bacteroides sp. 519]NDV56644.1 aminopeptidase [Bacteroides sp. 519]